MKLVHSLKNGVQNAWLKAGMMASVPLMLIANPAYALNKTDLTQDTSGGKKLQDVAANVDDAAQTGASLFIQIVSILGFVVVALSLWQLYKASKEDRESPMPAIVGLFIGGAMAAVGTIMWIMKSTVVG